MAVAVVVAVAPGVTLSPRLEPDMPGCWEISSQHSAVAVRRVGDVTPLVSQLPGWQMKLDVAGEDNAGLRFVFVLERRLKERRRCSSNSRFLKDCWTLLLLLLVVSVHSVTLNEGKEYC